jgi:hypothetical protein
MASSVPSPESFIESFPNSIPKIEGTPNFESLSNLRHLIKANAATVPSNNGGGQHGYLGIATSAAIYQTISPAPFTIPPNPGPQPIIPAGNPTAAQISHTIRVHTESLREWREYNNIHQALKTTLLNSIEPIYVRAKKDRHIGFANISLRELFSFLFAAYGQITPQALMQTTARLTAPWDPTTPFEHLIDQVEDTMELADAGDQPFSPNQVVNTAYTLVFNTGLYFDECKEWDKKPTADKTWTNFKTHFLLAQRTLRLQQQTSQHAGYHSNIAHHLDKENATNDALSCLTSAAESDRQSFAALLTNNNDLATKLTAAMQDIKTLQQNNSNNRNNGNNGNNGNNRNRTKNTSYCWTHGYKVSRIHNSESCQNPADGHQKTANRSNLMGGSTAGQPASSDATENKA